MTQNDPFAGSFCYVMLGLMTHVPLFSENLGEVESDEQLDVLQLRYGYDKGYLCQSTIKTRKRAREWLEALWLQYAPYADKHFLNQFRTAFSQRAWELYLGATILNRGYTLGANSGKGPDFDVLDGNRKRTAWIEAISVLKGEGVDAVPEMCNGVVVDVPTEAMSLRITHALKDKYIQYCNRLGKTVKEDEPYVIAIDRSALEHPEHIPLGLRVVYGIGNPVLRIPLRTKGSTEPRDWSKAESAYQRQDSIAKKSGEQISSAFFLNPEHAGISAIIYSSEGILNMPRQLDQLGESLLIAHNPHAKNPVVGKFTFGEEWVGDEDGARKIKESKTYKKPDPFGDLHD
jgi:hypothetical protein